MAMIGLDPNNKRLNQMGIRFVQKIFIVLAAFFLSSNVSSVAAQEVDWSGPYVGLTAGFGGLDYHVFEVGPFGSHFDSDQHSMSGFIAGASAGYNWNVGNFVVGIETNLSMTSLNDQFAQDSNWTCFDVCHNQLDWFGTGKLRFGVPIGNILPFASAGLAWGGIRQDLGDGVAPINKTANGWTIGAGLESAMSEHISMKVELNYIDFSEQYAGTKVGMKDSDFIMGQIGINYRF
jgi:outer membrane immunogenic protein